MPCEIIIFRFEDKNSNLIDHQVRDLEVRGSNLDSASNFFLNLKIVISRGTHYKFVSIYRFYLKRQNKEIKKLVRRSVDSR